jgi:hypothetical protein
MSTASATGWRTVAEQAAQWRCSKGAVHAAIDRGDLPATKIAGRWLIDPADAEKYEEDQRSLRRTVKRVRAPRRRPQRRAS